MFGPGETHNDVILPVAPTESNYRDLLPGEMEFIPIRFYSIKAMGSFLATCQDPKSEEQAEGEMMIWIKEPGVDYSKARGIEIEGNSMAPRYPHGARALVRKVTDGDWQHARGVHAVSTKTEMFVIKRIIDCENGVLVMRADNPDMPQTLRVPLSEVNCLWKVGEAYLPAER